MGLILGIFFPGSIVSHFIQKNLFYAYNIAEQLMQCMEMQISSVFSEKLMIAWGCWQPQKQEIYNTL